MPKPSHSNGPAASDLSEPTITVGFRIPVKAVRRYDTCTRQMRHKTKLGSLDRSDILRRVLLAGLPMMEKELGIAVPEDLLLDEIDAKPKAA